MSAADTAPELFGELDEEDDATAGVEVCIGCVVGEGVGRGVVLSEFVVEPADSFGCPTEEVGDVTIPP